jgi:hypothetical protein
MVGHQTSLEGVSALDLRGMTPYAAGGQLQLLLLVYTEGGQPPLPFPSPLAGEAAGEKEEGSRRRTRDSQLEEREEMGKMISPFPHCYIKGCTLI